MAIEIGDFLTQLMNMVPEADTELATIIRNQLIKQAVMVYSRDRPEIATDDVTGDGGKYYAINSTNFPSWSDELSRISAIQYPAPAVASDETPVYLDPEDWDEDYYAGGVRYLWLPNHQPASTETIRITYSAVYSWSAGTTTTGSINQVAHGFSLNDYAYRNEGGGWTAAAVNLLATHQVTTVTDVDNFTATELACSVPDIDFFAVCNKAACLVCQAIAEQFSRTTDSTISGDSVAHTTRAQQFADRAREFCRMYDEALDLVDGGRGRDDDGLSIERPHAEFIDLDPMPTFFAGRDYLFRGKHTR